MACHTGSYFVSTSVVVTPPTEVSLICLAAKFT